MWPEISGPVPRDLGSRTTRSRLTRYVIRLAHDRRLVGEHEKLRQVVGRATCLFRREVRVNPHGAGRPKDHHAVRQAREATLDVSAMAVELARSSHFAPGSPPSLKVHVVTVMERDCPEGDEPIAWYLVTNEPIATPEQVAAVVDVYALGRRRALQGAHERQPDREAPDGELRGIAR